MKKIIKGTGVTKREIVIFDTPEEQKADAYLFKEHFNKYENWFERIISDVEPWVLQTTADYNYDTVVVDDSELYFALQVRGFIRLIRSNIVNNDIDNAIRNSIELGEKLAEIRFKNKWEKFALFGQRFSESQSIKGVTGAEKRWGGEDREELSEIVYTLAYSKDVMGDFIPPRDIWPLLFSSLEKYGQAPREINSNSDKNNLTEACITYGHPRQEITYDAFRKRINRERKK